MSGSYSLEELQRAIMIAERDNILHLVGLEKGNRGDEQVNVANFSEVPFGMGTRETVLIDLSDAASVAKQLAQGRLFVFVSSIYVENKETRVAGLR